jgi:hypothetical protein
MKGLIAILVAVTALSFGSLAEAKGPTELTITGAGLDRAIVLDFRDGSPALSRILEAAAFFDTAFSPRHGLVDDVALTGPMSRPMLALGPRVRLTWSVEWYHTDHVDWSRTQHVVEDVYLYSRGGPVVYLPDGQQFLDRTLSGGWYRAGPDLVDALRSVGVPGRRVLAAAQQGRPNFTGTINYW